MSRSLLAVWVLAGATLVGDQLPPPAWNNAPAQPVPGVEHKTFTSRAASATVGYNVLLPPGYSTSDRR